MCKTLARCFGGGGYLIVGFVVTKVGHAIMVVVVGENGWVGWERGIIGGVQLFVFFTTKKILV
jgi:hypothetical protein